MKCKTHKFYFLGSNKICRDCLLTISCYNCEFVIDDDCRDECNICIELLNKGDE